ncbi:MAG: dihydropteroate synthase [bacterium]
MNDDWLIARSALELNPLVTGWDEQGRPTRVELADGTVVAADAESVRDRARELSGPAQVVLAALDAFAERPKHLTCRGRRIDLDGRTLVMGIINTTPDSFSDGGQFLEKEQAVEHGLELVAQGADLLDVGGESTRPGAEPCPADEELRRTEPVVAALAEATEVPISIDTAKPAVAAAALAAGASAVNDVTALSDPEMAPLVAEHDAGLVLMHMQGEPRSMQRSPHYEDVLLEITLYLRRAMARAVEGGVPLERVVVDPGIGFGKTLVHNSEIIRRLPVLASLGRPILMGCSRKSMIEHALGLPVERRLHPSLALNVLSVAGRASIIRVHDVEAACQAAAMADAVLFGTKRDLGGH